MFVADNNSCLNSSELKSKVQVLINFPAKLFYQAGVEVAGPELQVINGQVVEVWPRITWKPKWGLTFSQIKKKISGSCSISQRSTLVIKGKKVNLKNLSLDGALVVDAVDDAEVWLVNAAEFH